MALTKIQSHNLDTQDSVTIRSLVANGSTGTAGQLLTTDGANTYWSTVISGVKGDAGADGADGADGAAGAKGEKGDANGPKGDKGDAGSKGEAGVAGSYDVTLNTFTGNGSNTSYTLSTTPMDENHTIVTIYGVTQHKSTYSLTTDTISFSEAPPNNAPIEILVIAGGAKGEPGEYAGKGDKGNTGTAGTDGAKGDKGDSIVYPEAGVAVSNGTGWGTSKTAPSGTIVGTTDAQTLASKELSANSTTLDSDGTGHSIGFRRIPQNAQSAAYTVVNSDDGKHIYYTGSANTLTIPVDGATTGGDFNIGTVVTAINNGTANLTISISSGGTLYHAGTSNTGNRTLAVKGLATAMKVDGNTWFISGSGLT